MEPMIFLTVKPDDIIDDLQLFCDLHSIAKLNIRINLAKYSENVMENIYRKINFIKKHFPDITIMIDLPVPRAKDRVIVADTINVKTGQKIRISDNESDNNAELYVRNTGLLDLWKRGDIIKYGDCNGIFELISTDVNARVAILEAKCDCEIINGKSIITNKLYNSMGQLPKYIKIIKEISPNYVAFSFVESSVDMESIYKFFADNNIKTNIVAKIETCKGVENIASIAKSGDIMIGRGDICNFSNMYIDLLKVEADIAKITEQRERKLFVATGIMTSLGRRYYPTPADIADFLYILRLNPHGIILNREILTGKNLFRAYTYIKKYIDRFNSKTLQY